MASPYIKRHILNAIEHLRARKARPDLHRICNQLKRRHNCAIHETTRCIDHLMDMGIVIKVEYKGSMSYRDASKWKRGHVAGHIMNTNALVAKIQGAIDAIIEGRSKSDFNTPDGRTAAPVKTGERGATTEEIEAWFKKQNGENSCHLSGDALFEVLTREVETNTLKKSPEDGTYTVGRRVKITPRQKSASPPSQGKSEPDLEEKPLVQIISSTTPSESTNSYIDDKRQRPPSGRKRINKYKDEIYELPPIKKSRKQSNLQNQPMDPPAVKQEPKVKKEKVPFEEEYRLAGMFRLCNEVHQMEIPSRHEGQEAEMLVCCGCQMKAHPSCLSYCEELLAKIDRDTWRCVTCKKCAKCDLLLRTPSPMTCNGCDLAYHKSCHKPIMRKKPKEDWLCMRCTGIELKTEMTASAMEREETSSSLDCGSEDANSIKEDVHEEAEENNAKNTSFPPTPSASPLWDLDKASAEMLGIEPEQMREDQKVKKVSKFDGQHFPDPTNWTVEQVYEFVRNADGCYAEAADALKREEIDGEALMCLKREEVLSNFSLKVGPALKLHRFLTNMRTGGNAHMYV
ncbi:hypothetical protein V1264_023399 [Littorina saxatilis]|uniref:Uncharacterized protein n=1 Tax=Littorina saxatilis TaxID=31220 RepID=A0AAN9B6W4_9CAEN